MTDILNHPLFRLFFDLSANNGWNITAMMTYAAIVGLVALAIIEHKGN